MPLWPLPGGVVEDVPTEQNLVSLAESGGELEEDVEAIEKSGVGPSGKAGGVLGGEYPNPIFAVDMATQAELNTETATREEKDAAEKAARESADSTLTSNLATETSNRESADTTIKSEVATEKSSRESADTAIKAEEALEKAAREQGDNERVLGPGTNFGGTGNFGETGTFGVGGESADGDVVLWDGISGRLVKDGGDFNTKVRENRLDQMASPSANVSINEHKLTKVSDPTEALDAANKEYVDAAAAAAAAGLTLKPPVSYASIANVEPAYTSKYNRYIRPDFTGSTAGWSHEGNTEIAFSNSDVTPPFTSMVWAKITKTVGAGTANLYRNAYDVEGLTGGEKLTISSYVYPTAARNVRIRLLCRNSKDESTGEVSTGEITCSANTLKRVEKEVTLPAGTVKGLFIWETTSSLELGEIIYTTAWMVGSGEYFPTPAQLTAKEAFWTGTEHESKSEFRVYEETATTLKGTVPITVDGTSAFAVATRLLLKNQTIPRQNGIWEVVKDEAFGGEGTFGGEGKFGEGSAWELKRPTDADSESEVKQGMFVFVTGGATNKSTTWTLITANPIVIGTTAQEFGQFTATPVGAAGGALSGTFPEPTIKRETATLSVASEVAAAPGPYVARMTTAATVTIKKLEPGTTNQTVVLHQTAAQTLTMKDGENLKLAGEMALGENDTITLICDGSNWIETGRSNN